LSLFLFKLPIRPRLSLGTFVGNVKFALQQTELAFLTPPSQRSKARFMNVDVLVEWGRKTLALVDDPSGLERFGVRAYAPG